MENLEPTQKNSKWFDREHLTQDLKGKSVSGGLRTVGAQLFSFSLNIVTTIFLARLLLPTDYGLVAMVTSFTGFILIFKDLGMSQAIIQKDGLTQRIVSMVFWFNFYVSIALAGLILLIGPLLVMFYDEPKLLYISAIYAMTAIFGGLSTQQSALLSRQMRFKDLSSITMQASFFSLLPALYMAYMGMGYWALVAINVLNSAVTMILLWRRCNWRPDFVRIDKSIKEFVGFGAGISGFNMINYFARNLDNILIGKFLGSGPLGLYSKAYQLLMLPITQLRDPLNSVGIPALSSLYHKHEQYRKYYKEYLFLLSFFSMPIVVFLFISSEPLILFLLGPNWIEASEVFSLLAITAFIQPIASTRGMVMISSGHSTRYFFWGLWNAVFVTIAFVVGIQWGLNGLAIAYAIVNYLILIPSLYYCFHSTPIKVKDFFRTISPAGIISILAGMGLYFFVILDLELILWLKIILYGLIYLFIYLLLWIILPNTRLKLIGIISIIKSIIQKNPL